MDIDNQLDSLHLSETKYCKRRRLSGIQKREMEPETPYDSDLLENPVIIESIIREENVPPNINDGNASVRRSGRRKSAPVKWDGKSELAKTISSLSPITDNLAAIEKFYLDKTIKKTTTSLETIFEETQENKSSLQNVMSVRKFKRSINFSGKVAVGKIKKRHLKASKLNPRKRHNIKVSLEDLHKKLLSLERD